MPSCCPTCGHPIAAGDADARDALTLMRAAALMAGMKMTWDDHVTERDAARLLNRARSTLRNRRGLDCPIPFRKRAGRIEYALSDLAGFRE